MTRSVSINTAGKGVYEFTGLVVDHIRDMSAASGLLCCLVQHTTASLTLLGGVDEALRADLVVFLDKLAPESDAYAHHNTGPDDMPSHLKAFVTSPSLVVPVSQGRLMLGPTQGLFLLDIESRRRCARWCSQ